MVTDLAVAEWEELLGHIDLDDAVWALKQHRLTQPGKYFEPGSVIQQLTARRTAAALKPVDVATCHLHAGYPTPCHRCWADIEKHGTIQPVTMVPLGTLTAPSGRTP